MEKLINDVQSYADAIGRAPNWVIRQAVGAKYSAWDDWVAGRASPTMRTADRIRDYMAENTPEQVNAA